MFPSIWEALYHQPWGHKNNKSNTTTITTDTSTPTNASTPSGLDDNWRMCRNPPPNIGMKALYINKGHINTVGVRIDDRIKWGDCYYCLDCGAMFMFHFPDWVERNQKPLPFHKLPGNLKSLLERSDKKSADALSLAVIINLLVNDGMKHAY